MSSPGAADGLSPARGCAFLLEDQDVLEPGATALVRLHPIYPEAWKERSTGCDDSDA